MQLLLDITIERESERESLIMGPRGAAGLHNPKSRPIVTATRHKTRLLYRCARVHAAGRHCYRLIHELCNLLFITYLLMTITARHS